MATDTWLDQYATWLREQYRITALTDGDEISTPFTNSLGDNIRLYASSDASGRAVLTDDGNTLNDLEMMGVDVSNQTRQMLIDSTLQQYDVLLDADGILRVVGPYREVPLMKQRLLQAILRVDDLVQTRKGVVSNIFNQEVAKYLYDRDIGALLQYSVVGSTGNPYTIDFAIAGSKTHPLRLVQAINRLTFERIAAESATFDDIRMAMAHQKTKLRYIVLYNDLENPMPEKASKLAAHYGTELCAWSQKDRLQLN
ncbi:DUF1828 domain-containing protein [Lacticaseibacillus parakribbianus]|uniref:DUF1828 domain-containing protein n=1 Tax=Lacticaseibacillus parakribbianus TaxID=2970927 RepID=UPI0021CB45B6|nr:DUF1828 domain-containing protein [Lacticaseibacillus parakribbianus]